MIMPQDFIDAINQAVKAISPNAGTMTSGSFTLGSEFDEFVGPEALAKFGVEPLDQETQKRFWAKWTEKREEIKAALVESAVEVERKRMAGFDFKKASDDWLAEDKARCEARRKEFAEFRKKLET